MSGDHICWSRSAADGVLHPTKRGRRFMSGLGCMTIQEPDEGCFLTRVAAQTSISFVAGTSIPLLRDELALSLSARARCKFGLR